MSSFIYSQMEGKNDPLFGHYEHPIKAIIESESNNQERQRGVLDMLYNVEKSNRYAEAVISETDFQEFQATEEGQGAENDSVEPGYKKVIEHIAYMKEFTITRQMADDAKGGISADISRKPRKFVDAYYKTRTKIAEQALVHGASGSFDIYKAHVDLTTGDGLSLFNKAHTSATGRTNNQTNYFCNGTSTSHVSDSSSLEDLIGLLANKMRNFKDEQNDNLGYVADTIILPANRFKLESNVKKIVGSERTTGTNYNDINLQYGNWNIVVLDSWSSDNDKFMIMSSAANESLMGNMFYNRVPLDITSWVDKHTRNYIWNGYCRFGIGFTTWKHILMYDDAQTNAAATALFS